MAINYEGLTAAMDLLTSEVESHAPEDRPFAWAFILKRGGSLGITEFFRDNPEMLYLAYLAEDCALDETGMADKVEPEHAAINWTRD